MKQHYLCLMAVLVIFIAGCSANTGRDTGHGFILEPGSVSQYTVNVNKSFSTTYDGENYGPAADCYAIITNINVDGTAWVGITISDDPDVNNSFSMRIRFPSSGIPSSVVLDSADTSQMIKIRHNASTTWHEWSAGTITLSITNQGDGTYIITRTAGSVTVDGQALDDLTIRAQKYP